MKEDKKVIYFLTQNERKFFEAKDALSSFPYVEIRHLNEPKPENKDDTVEDALKEIAVAAAVSTAKRCGKTVVAEDSGLFFNAYKDFPAMNTKWLIKRVGYEGIFRLLNGVDRGAYFRTVLAISEPNGEYKVFEGTVNGSIAEKVFGENVNCMDYDRIFVPEELGVPFALKMEEKERISHRSAAFRKLGEYLSQKK